MTSFSPTTYLTSQGWDGPGTALKKGGLKKPITVAHKTNLKGIGKERDTGYAWWDDVFSMVANKGKGKASEAPREDMRRTSTGIYSSRAPSAQTSGASTPVHVPAPTAASQASSTFNTDIIGQARLEAARREFYSKFCRGKPLAGTAGDEDSKTAASSKATILAADLVEQQEQDKDKASRKMAREERRRLRREKRSRKEEKRRRKSEKLAAVAAAAPSASAGQLVPEEATTLKPKKDKKRKREERAVQDDPAGASAMSQPLAAIAVAALPTPPPSGGEEDAESLARKKLAKRARKAEKRAAAQA